MIFKLLIIYHMDIPCLQLFSSFEATINYNATIQGTGALRPSESGIIKKHA